MMQLSFIIPAYNASSTIVRALDSIYNLPMKEEEFEVIVIDDCSTDDTLAILQNYASKQPNLHVLHQEQNHRQGAARNRGLREAKGQYVMFVDADDMVEEGVPQAVRQIETLQVDVLFCNYLWMYSQTDIERRKMSLQDGYVTSGRDFCELYFDTITNSCPISYIWRKDYLLEKGVFFLEDRRMEDFDWIERNVYQAKRIGYSEALIYRVMTFENLNSTTHTVSPETSADWAHVGYRRMLFCDEIRKEAPRFAEKIEFQSRCFVANIMKVRNFTKFSPRGIIQLKRRVGQNAFDYLLAKGGWSIQTQLCMRYIEAFVLLNCAMYPVALYGRSMVQLIRKIKHQ